MNCLNSIHIVLFLLPILINCNINKLEYKCHNEICASYKSNKTKCENLGHVINPFNNECVSRCDGPCINGYCDYCFCYSANTEAVMSAQPSECKRILNGTYCPGTDCFYNPIESCNSNYTHNLYSNYECLERCDKDSCGKGGTCSPLGHCICHLGYRPDVRNPRVCVKIPKSNTTVQEMTCHKGFKLNDDGECVSTCGDCKNGCCGTDGVCQCWENYELDVASSTCVIKEAEVLKLNCSDRCLNGICDLDGVCQCPDCSDFINSTINCQIVQNNTGAGGLDTNYNCGNNTLRDDIISKTTHKTTIAILLSITVILLIATIILMFIALRMKRASPLNEGKVKILFGKSG